MSNLFLTYVQKAIYLLYKKTIIIFIYSEFHYMINVKQENVIVLSVVCLMMDRVAIRIDT